MQTNFLIKVHNESIVALQMALAARGISVTLIAPVDDTYWTVVLDLGHPSLIRPIMEAQGAIYKEPYTLVFGEKETPVSCKQTVRYVSRAEDAINLIVRIGTPDAIYINKLTSSDTDTESFIRWIREMLVQNSLFYYPVKVTFLPEDDSKLPSYYANEVEPLMQQAKSLAQQLMDAWDECSMLNPYN